MSLWNPHVLWDIGFQLSFAATLGLVLYADSLNQYFIRRAAKRLPLETAERLAGPVGEYFLYTLAAQLMVLPVILYHFKRMSIISFFANPLILPVQPPLMLLGGLSLVLGLIVEPLGQLVAYLAWPLVTYTIRVVEWLAGAPVTDWMTGGISFPAVVLFFAVLLAATFAGERVRSWSRRVFESPSRNAVVLLVLVGLSAVLVWRLALEAPDGRLHLIMLDTGGGEAFLVQSPEGRYLLINGGPSASRLSAALGRRLPLGNRRLDYLVVSGSTDEQLGALPETVPRFPPVKVLWSGTRIGENSVRRLQARLVEADIPVEDAKPGHVLDLGDGAHLEVLATNQQGAVLWLVWGQFRALLPLGMDFDTMKQLQTDPALGPVTVLLLAQSGLASLNTPDWIDQWQPQVLFLSVAAGNAQGLPNRETLQAATGYNLLRTDQNGWVKLSTDGQHLWIEVER
jgi:competence protein ComEC